MRIQTEEWRRFIPGVRMYRGKRTLFYNGEILVSERRVEFLRNGRAITKIVRRPLIYDKEERDSWEVIIVLPGVEVIPQDSFRDCEKVEEVIMNDLNKVFMDSIKKIEDSAFYNCKKLRSIRFSRRLEYIGKRAFSLCVSLTSIFIPPSCQRICIEVFHNCSKLIILSIPKYTKVCGRIIEGTALIKAAPFNYSNSQSKEVNRWLKTRHVDNTFSLHRICSSDSLHQLLYDFVQDKGLKAFKEMLEETDEVGITLSQYLSKNPYTEKIQQIIINHYILNMLSDVA